MGIGVVLKAIPGREGFFVRRVLPNGPPELCVGDCFIALGGVSLFKTNVSDLSALLRGPAGSSVTVTVKRVDPSGHDVELKLNLNRAQAQSSEHIVLNRPDSGDAEVSDGTVHWEDEHGVRLCEDRDGMYGERYKIYKLRDGAWVDVQAESEMMANQEELAALVCNECCTGLCVLIGDISFLDDSVRVSCKSRQVCF